MFLMLKRKKENKKKLLVAFCSHNLNISKRFIWGFVVFFILSKLYFTFYLLFLSVRLYIITCVNLVMELKLRFYTQIYLCNKITVLYT